MKSKSELAGANFAGGFNCSTSVLLAFCEDYDVDAETAARIACGFGGGCASGEVCGAVAGGVMVVGLKYGQGSAEDTGAKANCHNHILQFNDTFKEKNGAVACRDLLECDTRTDEGYEIYLAKRGTVCPALIKSSAQILEELEY